MRTLAVPWLSKNILEFLRSFQSTAGSLQAFRVQFLSLSAGDLWSESFSGWNQVEIQFIRIVVSWYVVLSILILSAGLFNLDSLSSYGFCFR